MKRLVCWIFGHSKSFTDVTCSTCGKDLSIFDLPRNYDIHLGGCWDLAERFDLPDDHCDSCHGLGYGITSVALHDGYYDACCKMALAFEQKTGRSSV